MKILYVAVSLLLTVTSIAFAQTDESLSPAELNKYNIILNQIATKIYARHPKTIYGDLDPAIAEKDAATVIKLSQDALDVWYLKPYIKNEEDLKKFVIATYKRIMAPSYVYIYVDSVNGIATLTPEKLLDWILKVNYRGKILRIFPPVVRFYNHGNSAVIYQLETEKSVWGKNNDSSSGTYAWIDWVEKQPDGTWKLMKTILPIVSPNQIMPPEYLDKK